MRKTRCQIFNYLLVLSQVGCLLALPLTPTAWRSGEFNPQKTIRITNV
jgi:hypothetical protein